MIKKKEIETSNSPFCCFAGKKIGKLPALRENAEKCRKTTLPGRKRRPSGWMAASQSALQKIPKAEMGKRRLPLAPKVPNIMWTSTLA